MNSSEMASARVLVLDDDPALGAVLGEMLQMLGHQAIVCQVPEEALALLEREAFDLILSDFRMPGMSGSDFFQQVVERHPRLARKVVFLSGDVSSNDTHFFFKATRSTYLMKPFRLSDVEAVTQKILAETLGEAAIA